MELKRFVGPDMRTALRLVREELGPDAIILSNRRVAAGVEIMAGPEEPVDRQAQDGRARVAVPPPAALPQAAVPHREAAAGTVTAPLAISVPAARAELTQSGAPVEMRAMQSELRELRALLEERLHQYQRDRLAWGPGAEGRAWRRLTRLGLPNAAVSELVAGIAPQSGWEEAWGGVRERLQRSLREAGDLIASGGAFAVVGPTGAGKTTTVCKLAVRHVLQHGNADLALIGLDGSRLGGSEMLRALARLLEVPFLSAQHGEQLPELLECARERSLVLIDTAGISRRRTADAAQLEAIAALAGRVRCLQVLPANAQYASHLAALADYRAAQPVAAVITKLDETVSLGEALGALGEAQLPVAYTTDGPDIPDDLRVADAVQLVEQALALACEDEQGGSRTRTRSPALAMDIAARIA